MTRKIYDTTDFPYSFKRYTPGSKTECPECHKKKCFSLYVVKDTGEEIDPRCGRCDHEQSCGYHLPPREFFRLHPSHPARRYSRGNDGSHPWNDTCTHTARIARSIQYTEPTVVDFGTLTQWDARQTVESALECDFAQGLRNYFDMETIAEAISRYHIQSVSYYRNTAFPCINAEGKVTDVMTLAYGSDLHRTGNVYHYYGSKDRIAQLKATHPGGYKYNPCYFGEHLLPLHPDRNVALVESQKSAVVCSMLLPGMVWLATCGSSNFTASKSLALKDRRVFVYPDKGMAEKWGKTVRELQSGGYNIHLRTIMEEEPKYDTNSDICDVLLESISSRVM